MAAHGQATAVPVPDTVEEVLMARIDRLPGGAKSVLQIGAVIGRELSGELLQEVAGLPEQELTTHLAALTEAELLYARGVPPQTTYLFKHAFTQEAAYRSLLTAQRHDLHHRVAVTLETLFPDRLEEYYGQLAHHYLEGGAGATRWPRPSTYAVRAGERYMALPAYAEAVRFYHMALQALERQAPVDEAQRCTLLLALGEAQRKAGESRQALDTFQRAADSRQDAWELCRALARLPWSSKARHGGQASWLEPAVRLLEEALQALGEAEHVRCGREPSAVSPERSSTLACRSRQQHMPQQAVAMARRVGDPAALAFSLQTS